MTRSIFSILLALSLCSCAPKLTTRVQHGQLLHGERSLWQLTIGNLDKPRFTGLLALRDSGSGFDAVLLDSTGIKLLSERITPDGEIEVQSAVPILEKKGLPGFLGDGLHRIFQHRNKNTTEPCYRDILVRICYGENDNGILVKSAGIGPFKLWSVEYFINKDKDEFYLTGVKLDQGWFKPEMRLQRMKP